MARRAITPFTPFVIAPYSRRTRGLAHIRHWHPVFLPPCDARPRKPAARTPSPPSGHTRSNVDVDRTRGGVLRLDPIHDHGVGRRGGRV